MEYEYWCMHIEACIKDGRVEHLLRVEGTWRHAHFVAAVCIAVKLPMSKIVA